MRYDLGGTGHGRDGFITVNIIQPYDIQSDAKLAIKQWIDGELTWRAMRSILFTPAHRIDSWKFDLELVPNDTKCC